MQSPTGVLTEWAGKHLKGQGEAHDEEFAPKSTAHQWQHSEGTGLLDIKSGKTLLPIWYTSWTGFAALFFFLQISTDLLVLQSFGHGGLVVGDSEG